MSTVQNLVCLCKFAFDLNCVIDMRKGAETPEPFRGGLTPGAFSSVPAGRLQHPEAPQLIWTEAGVADKTLE